MEGKVQSRITMKGERKMLRKKRTGKHVKRLRLYVSWFYWFWQAVRFPPLRRRSIIRGQSMCLPQGQIQSALLRKIQEHVQTRLGRILPFIIIRNIPEEMHTSCIMGIELEKNNTYYMQTFPPTRP